MAEVEIDQSNLPRVQDVRQNFAVLEDGVLAHSLQEQEIEQYYTTNIQKNQLVQNDIRVAKQLQDEEDRTRAQQRALLRQTSRQIEERDFQYARTVQEEIQQRAEEVRRRERDDEEIAKRLQEEEEQRMRRSSSGSSSGAEERTRGAAHRAEPSSLDLTDLQQVLQDEELARLLQQEEERQLRRARRPWPAGESRASPPRSFPAGDFRLAQVAQDEEIARFMQKQEIKSKRRSRELDGPGSWKEHRAMMTHHDRSARDTEAASNPPVQPSLISQVQVESPDSEGPASPTEDQLPPSPTSVTPPQHLRNIAEELDPTFQARRRSTEAAASCCPPLLAAPSGFLEEPAFIPPTKRPAEKAGRRERRERWERPDCKQQ